MGVLEDRVVVVTGASSGIGQAVAERCAQEGARVLASGRRRDALDTICSFATAGFIVPFVADLGDPHAAERLMEAALAEFGRLDGVVHAAGTVRRGEDVRMTTDAEFAEQIESNLSAAFRVARSAVRWLIAQGGGSVVLLGSQVTEIGAPGYASYTAAKGGVTALARVLAVDHGADGVRVNVLAPGVVKTPMAYVDRPEFDSLEEGIAARHPLRRIGEPRDIAGPAVFLLSEDSAWMTGHTLVVDGGYTIQ
jgi:NAD(P)-dependent dehydrogenase (short-subunit alcohol dehydrogenase family)